MAPRPRATQSLESRRTRGIKSYRCRVCSGIHALRKCKRFHKLSAEKRLRAVLINKYCSNCLAHQHSGGDCRSQEGCKKCGGDHHTLLHMHEVLPAPNPAALPAPTRRERHPAAPRPVRISRTPPPAPVANNRPRQQQQKAVPILPTAIVVLDTGSKTFETGAMIDPCMPVSSIDRSLAAAFRLPITRLGSNEICSVTLRSRTSTFRLNVVLKIEPSLRIRTPIRALSDAARAKFDGVRLADERFHRPASISLVLGSDVYANLIQPGFLKIEDGLPVAQNTVFGWTVSGTCAK
ncbi:uncharacterized protein LOC120285787 [Drosophila simulans]|uniref:uncharacterized protein LOC120285438 n=1 Tax=Drosophila simulans TaxID=7240 RepID=UPI00192CEBD7|nr:uncharacterized protein LOC120285438 [Drosophila simulans]XP_039154313.1 uncharacterized protein LOC120285787 [Drosophila simulans]